MLGAVEVTVRFKESNMGKRKRNVVEEIYRRIGNGVQVPLLSLPRIYKAGEVAWKAGLPEHEVEAKMKAVIEEVRVN